MNLQEAITHILSGNAILFTGSGFSRGATNLLGEENPKTGNELTAMFYQRCGITENDYDLKNASQLFQEEHGESELITVLRKEYTITSVSPDQELVASLPWRRIYTTNYDNVLEFSAHKSRKLLSPVTITERIDQYKDKRTFCVHLNGYIERLNSNTLRNEFKLTNASYLTSDFLKSAWVDLFRHDIQNAKAVFFIGFSCDNDLDISRIISEHTVADTLFFIVREGESKLAVKKLQRYGNVHDIQLSGLADRIREVMEDYTDGETGFSEPRSFIKCTTDFLVPSIKDIDLLDLFYKGTIKDNLIHYSLMDAPKYPYYIKRKQIQEVIDYMKNGGRNILIHSDLGNGKTLFIHGLADELVRNGHEVYIFKKNFPQTSDEIESLCTYKPKAVIIIENYSQNLDVLKRLALFRTDETTVIVTERSMLNDTYYPALENYLFGTATNYITKNLNLLSYEEIGQIVRLLNQYGLWGNVAGQSEERRTQIFLNDYNGSFRLFLLALLDSPDIKKRFTDLLLSIKNINESYFRATLLILAANLFGFNLDFNDLLNILDDELLENPAFYNNDNLMEIIDFNEQKLLVRSSILAESLLKKNNFHDDLIELLIDVVKKLDTRLYDKNSYTIIKSIASFSRLQIVFNLNENPAFKPVILSFFEEIKTTYYAKKNPHFWLQYAIARLSSRDYPIAKQYFDTAYGYAKSASDFDTYQIDNHYARYLIENEIINGAPDTCMEVFIQVHTILSNKSDANSNRHYPIRVAINYGRFYEIFYKTLKEADQAVFILSCKEILDRIDQYKKVTDERAWNKNVKKCEDELTRILKLEGVKL
ncbi:MAG: SIR2 family protein [Parabacteroides sp.]|nr:SIR2 family protein [Parabacteroides sp.]